MVFLLYIDFLHKKVYNISIKYKILSIMNTTNNITWSNGIGSRGREPFLLFIKGDEIIPFNGNDINGIVVIRGTDYTKNGKWSHTTYRLEMSSNVRYIAGSQGWETGRFVEGLGSVVGCKTPDTWLETANALGVSVPSTMEFLRSWLPKAAEKLDEVEESLIKLEEISEQKIDSETVTVSFGCPTNRAISEGYWTSPKEIPGYDAAEILLKDSSKGWSEGNIEVSGIQGAVLSVKHTRGMHGGYYAVSVAVIPGTNILPEESPITGQDTLLGDALRKSGIVS